MVHSYLPILVHCQLPTTVMWQKEYNKGKPIAAHTKDGFFYLYLPYKPFEGRVSNLSHYIRHLFQTVKYIDEQTDNLLSYSDKYYY